MFENDITFIDSRYNYSEWMVDTDSSPVMYHFIGDFKPFRMFKKLVPQLFATKYFDVYYRVQAQKFGWLGWAKNGIEAGSAGYSYRLEAIQIMLGYKDTFEPVAIGNSFKAK